MKAAELSKSTSNAPPDFKKSTPAFISSIRRLSEEDEQDSQLDDNEESKTELIAPDVNIKIPVTATNIYPTRNIPLSI